MREVEQKVCPECNITFDCGGVCWCNKYPPIMPVTPNNGCYCEKCLHIVMVKRVDEIMADLTPEMRIKIKALEPAKQLIEDIDYTLDAAGNKVYSKWYLLRKG